jgi:hypothetical protein
VTERVALPKIAADTLRDLEAVVRRAVQQRDLYGLGVRDALGLDGQIVEFDEATGELVLSSDAAEGSDTPTSHTPESAESDN